jgi:hypothetical protein
VSRRSCAPHDGRGDGACLAGCACGGALSWRGVVVVICLLALWAFPLVLSVAVCEWVSMMGLRLWRMCCVSSRTGQRRAPACVLAVVIGHHRLTPSPHTIASHTMSLCVVQAPRSSSSPVVTLPWTWCRPPPTARRSRTRRRSSAASASRTSTPQRAAARASTSTAQTLAPRMMVRIVSCRVAGAAVTALGVLSASLC